MKALCFDPVAGAAGDMILASLCDLGADPAEIARLIRTGGLDGFDIQFRRAQDQHGLVAGYCDVVVEHHDHGHHHDDHTHEHHHRHLGDILEIVDTSSAPDRAKERARAVFRRLAEAEAAVHGIEIEKVHFHEVGAVDSIVDVFGSCIALELLGVDRVYCAELKVGKGTIRCAHGVLPVPVPATSQLIAGFDVIRLDIKTELTTPTGAALLTTLSEGDWSALRMHVTNCGIGHGGRDLDEMPNIIRSFLVEIEDPAQQVEVLETDIDDDTPEMTAALAERLLAEGALDVTRIPVYMKKGRLGTRLTVLTKAGDVQRIANLILGSSSTIGVRVGNARRFTLPRHPVQVDTPWGPVKAKEITRPSGIEIVPEYEACRELAESAGVELRRVMQAVRSWRDPE